MVKPIKELKLGVGGTAYIAKVLGCDAKTIHAGRLELEKLPNSPAHNPAIRKAGPGFAKGAKRIISRYLTRKGA